MKYLFIVDDGHGIGTAGKRTPILSAVLQKIAGKTQMRENDFNRVVVDYIKELMENNEVEVEVFLTAPELSDVSLSTRTARANKKYDEYVSKYGKNGFKCVLVSVHANAYKGVFGNWGGIDTFYYKNTKTGDKLAEVVQDHLIKGSPLRDRGTKPSNFHMVRESKMTAVLCELGFMDSLHDVNYLLSDDYRKECSEEISAGVCEYFGIPFKQKKKEADVLYKVQIGAFGSKESAEKLEAKAKKAGFDTYIAIEEK